MKTILLSMSIALASANMVSAQPSPPKVVPPTPPPPPPVSTAQPAVPASGEKFVYEQKPNSDRPYLITPEQAQTVLHRFKDAYAKMGSPRILIYVNRELVDETSGLKLSARSEQTESERRHLERRARSASGTTTTSASAANAGVPPVSGEAKKTSTDSTVNPGTAATRTDKVSSKNTYRVQERKEALLSDKQTVRDVERLFGAPLRKAGATLVDQRVATQLIGDKPLKNFTAPTEGEQARKDREALAKLADVVLEILISSRQQSVPAASGDKVYAVPDIQATAIRLKDSKIVGQASASDLIGQGPASAARNFGVREISEATALALMEDMTLWP